jgi:polyisoprenoid-binding protein YceI
MHAINRLFVLSAAAILLAGPALAETYTVDAEHSSVNFSVRHLVSRTAGRFNDFSGTIKYDPVHAEKTSAEIAIQVSSLDTDNEKRDGHLRSADFFNAEEFATITFKSTKAKVKDDVIHLTGDFTMHGVTKSITLPVEILGMGAHPFNKKLQAGFATHGTILRSDYGVNTWTDVAGVLGDEVRISLTVEANYRRY